jgi:xylan 1,4-beta-xylosidase
MSMPSSDTLPDHDFHAQHSPMGAFFSFTCGHHGAGGGFGVEIGGPARQGITVGVKQGRRTADTPLVCLPFVKSSALAAAAATFQVEQASATSPPGRRLDVYAADRVRRTYLWATDRWETADLSFELLTPFGAIPDPEAADAAVLREALLPAVTARFFIDNREGKDFKTGVFGIDFDEPGARIITGEGGSVGFAWRRRVGALARVDRGALVPLQRWSIPDALTDVNPVHALGSAAGFAVEVPPGETRTVVIALGVYVEGVATTGLEGRYLYTRYYHSVEEVLEAALDCAPELARRAARLDATLAESGLTSAQQFHIAHGTRSYYGSTQLLEVDGKPLWVVNEGEYCMMNTLDLSVDQMFWELDQNPWVVRNLLDAFADRYSYSDQYGISFAHDMGVHNNFARPGHSSYELGQLTGCFSYMTAEQLCNYILLAATYAARAPDGQRWAEANRGLLESCGRSLIARCGPAGVIQHDSSRCQGGAEITTYDSLDHSLAQTRNNLYMAVKVWASFLGLARLLPAGTGGKVIPAAKGESDGGYEAHAGKAAATVLKQVLPDGTIPAVFEPDSPGYKSGILPAVEGLIYPLMWQQDVKPKYADLYAALSRHAVTLLQRGDNTFPDGGIRLSSTSNNSWMSKIAIFQHVMKEVLGYEQAAEGRELMARADVAHMRWQITGSREWACSDQFVSGEAKGSRYYPRIITTALWLAGGRNPAPTGVPDVKRQAGIDGGRATPAV